MVERPYLAFPVFQTIMAVTGIFAGRISDKIGPRNVVIAAAVCYGVGWFMSGTVTEPWQFYLWFSLVAAIGNGLGYNPALTTGQKWFIDKKGLASGITLAASTAGPAVLSPVLASLLIPNLGIFGALKALGVIFFVTIAASALFLKAPEAGWLPEASRPPRAARTPAPSVTSPRARWSRPRASGPHRHLRLCRHRGHPARGQGCLHRRRSALRRPHERRGRRPRRCGGLRQHLRQPGWPSVLWQIIDKLGAYKSLLISLVVTIVASSSCR